MVLLKKVITDVQLLLTFSVYTTLRHLFCMLCSSSAHVSCNDCACFSMEIYYRQWSVNIGPWKSILGLYSELWFTVAAELQSIMKSWTAWSPQCQVLWLQPGLWYTSFTKTSGDCRWVDYSIALDSWWVYGSIKRWYSFACLRVFLQILVLTFGMMFADVTSLHVTSWIGFPTRLMD